MSTTPKKRGGKRRSADWPACKPVLPSIAAPDTGSLSRWSTAREQYLDSLPAGKIDQRPGQDRISGKKLTVTKPHFAPAKARRAARLQSDSPKPRAKTKPLKAGPPQRPQAVVGGRAGRSRETPPVMGLLCEYIPISWHHEKGIIKVVRRLLPRLPDVSGMLFLTFSLDRNLFSGPASAFELARQRIRKLFARLRKGIMWMGKTYKIAAPYCVKVEFHGDDEGWVHFHVILLTRRFIPGDLLNYLWDLGRVNVARISNDDFHYLLKYSCKGVGYPPWALSRRRLRIFQPSHGFLLAVEKPEAKEGPKTKRERVSYTIGQRLERWSPNGAIQLPR